MIVYHLRVLRFEKRTLYLIVSSRRQPSSRQYLSRKLDGDHKINNSLSFSRFYAIPQNFLKISRMLFELVAMMNLYQ